MIFYKVWSKDLGAQESESVISFWNQTQNFQKADHKYKFLDPKKFSSSFIKNCYFLKHLLFSKKHQAQNFQNWLQIRIPNLEYYRLNFTKKWLFSHDSFPLTKEPIAAIFRFPVIK